jgi:hypothetical protein
MKKLEIYGRTYIAKLGADELIFDIKSPEDEPKPDSLYKLYGISKYSIDSLRNNYIYATHPNQFNDLFDCWAELIDFDNPAVAREILKTVVDDKIVDSYDEYLVKLYAQRNFRELFYRKVGLFCATTDPNSLLMWSYYTNHSGFALEYEIANFPFKYYGPFPINYQQDIQPVSVNKHSLEIAILLQSNLKHIDWKHENEWRLIIPSEEGSMKSPNFRTLKELGGQERKFYYPEKTIKSILLGNRFFDPDEIEIIDDKVLKVNLFENSEEKREILEIIFLRNITIYFAQRDTFKIGFAQCILEKTSDTEYKLVRI